MQKFALLTFVLCTTLCTALQAQETIQYYLSGTDKDHTVNWDFYCTKGRKSGAWTTIPVPSNWEQQGFGNYNYGHDKVKYDEQGLYKYKFPATPAWKGKQVFLVFEGAMTDVEVKINGKPAGPIHQGGFYRFKYNITSLLKAGTLNELSVTVSKVSANASVNRAERNGDFWVLGGIYRPVYLEVTPHTYIDRVAVDAKANGALLVGAYTNNTSNDQVLEAQVQTLQGENVGAAFTVTTRAAQGTYTLQQQLANPALWSPEFPNLYQLVLSIKKGNAVIHTIRQRFGFRTVEQQLRDGIYVNGRKVIFKGVNRHSLWPETGRTLSKEISLLDVNLIKDMNMNAVRMSHYPPDQHFLDVCDSLGLFVLDELTGWQAAYDTVVGKKLVKELVVRDVNHPSVVIWDNGNEGGWNRALVPDYALYDPQKRLVIHPWERFNGMDTKHYPVFNYVVNSGLYSQEIFMPTEFMHGLYDGGHGAGLDDFWNGMLQHPRCAGGFLWAFHDEGIMRTDKQDSIDTDGNHAPDGIVGPHREKEGSFYTIKEIWSPVHIDLPVISPGFDGAIPVENRFLYTRLDQCRFQWKLLRFPAPQATDTTNVIVATGAVKAPAIAPGEKGTLAIALPQDWATSDALYLTAYDPHGREIFTWSWPLKTASQMAHQYISTGTAEKITATEQEEHITINNGELHYVFNKQNGYLEKVQRGAATLSLSGGPVLAGVKQALQSFKHDNNGAVYTVEARYEGNGWLQVKWTFAPGAPAKLEYQYSQRGEAPYMGITFNYPEEKIAGLRWLGRGPYRVWKNRLKGQQWGVWQKAYNQTITGESWQYPEFAGYHAELYWATIDNTEFPFTVYTAQEGLFLQMLQPKKPAGANNDNTSPLFPPGNIGFLNAISPIGTKFQDAALMGPQSQANIMMNYTPVGGSLWFDFR